MMHLSLNSLFGFFSGRTGGLILLLRPHSPFLIHHTHLPVIVILRWTAAAGFVLDDPYSTSSLIPQDVCSLEEENTDSMGVIF
jgi:hypothetical protein